MNEKVEENKINQNRENYWKQFSFWIGSLFILLFLIIMERNQLQKVEVKIRDNLKKMRDLESIVLSYQLEERLLFRPERLENISKNELNMIEPSADNIIELIVN